MAISATQIATTNTLENFRQQFNNLQTDVNGLESGTLTFSTISATTTSTSESVLSLLSYTSVFTQVGIVAIGMSVISFMITPVLKKWMHGVH